MPSRARLSVVLVLAAVMALSGAGSAAAAQHLPPKGKVFHGIALGDSYTDWQRRTGTRPAVWQQFIQWGGSMEYAFRRAEAGGARLMLHVSTSAGQNLPGVIAPAAIARGDGDRWLVALGARLAAHGRPVYLRVMGEMNNCDLPYASHGCDGRRRGASHSAAAFKRAWRRIHAVVRGGARADVDRRLRALGLPRLRAGAQELARPQVAFVWSPMTGGSPMISALRPERFWPGARFVDWVGTSFYSRYPNFRWLTPYYERFAVRHRKPFVLAEWAIWGGDHAGFARTLFSWVHRHRRTRMMIYNQTNDADGVFRLRWYPNAARVIRRQLRSPRFVR
jgi:hypothetical protein